MNKNEIITTRTKTETGRVEDGHHAYEIRIHGKNHFEVQKIYFPMKEWGNNQTEYMTLRTTTKRGVIESYETRDNWNGSGGYDGGKQFVSKEYVEQEYKLAEEIMKIEDDDDRDAETIDFVKKIFVENEIDRENW